MTWRACVCGHEYKHHTHDPQAGRARRSWCQKPGCCCELYWQSAPQWVRQRREGVPEAVIAAEADSL